MGAVNLLGGLALDSTLTALKDLISGLRSASGQSLAVGNARSKFRDSFGNPDGTYPNPDTWNVQNDLPDTDGTGRGHLIMRGGDANGSSYLRISMSPFEDNSSVWLTSKESFQLPMRVGWGVSSSQRVLGQELFFGSVEADETDPLQIKRMDSQTPTDIPISGTTGVVTSNSLVLQMPVGHPFKLGDRVIVVGAPDTRFNVGPVYLTGASATDIAIPLTIANGTYTLTGAAIRAADPVARGRNGFGMLLENATVTNASLVSRRNGSKFRQRNSTIGTTTATSGGNWSDAILAASVQEHFLNMDECSYRSFGIDSNGGMNGGDKFHQAIPDEELDYRMVVRARNLDYMSRPIARAISMAKTGSTTATIVTDRPHGLTTASRIGIYGTTSLTVFPNTADAAVASVVNDTTFTVVFGTAVTGTLTNGGVIFLNNGGVTSPGAFNFGVTAIARTNNVLQVTLNTTAAGFIIGEYVHLWGMNGTGAAAYENAYKVLRMTGSVLELESAGPNFGSITTGGAIIRRTEHRIHFVRVLDHTRHYVEILGGRATTADANNAVPVSITNSATLNMSVTNVPEFSIRTKMRDTWPASTTVLAANAVYTLSSVDQGTTPAQYDSKLRVTVMHAAGIAAGTLIVESSTDNTTFRETDRVPIPSDGLYHTFDFDQPAMRYFRYRFVNGAVLQTAFYLGHSSFRGEPSQSRQKVLAGFHVTPVAGMALTAGQTIVTPTYDLGGNHSWDSVRLFWRTDVAGVSMVVEQSLDGTNWFWADGRLDVGVGSGSLVSNICARYVRIRVTTGSTASTLTVATMALVGR